MENGQCLTLFTVSNTAVDNIMGWIERFIEQNITIEAVILTIIGTVIMIALINVAVDDDDFDTLD